MLPQLSLLGLTRRIGLWKNCMVNGGSCLPFKQLFSSLPPPPIDTRGGGFRIQRPDLRSGGEGFRGQQRGGGGRGRGRGRGRGGRGGRGRTNPYKPVDRNQLFIKTAGVPGPRPHSITVFPGDFGDDPSVPDDNDDVKVKGEKMQEALDGGQEDMRKALLAQQEWEEARKNRWIENAKAKEWKSIIDERGRAYGRGGRKSAQARVWISPGLGEIVVNQLPFCDYFGRQTDREKVLAPLVATETLCEFDVQVAVKGGGLTGQANAVLHGLARALNAYNPDLYRPPLKYLGFLTRDSRRVERKVQGRVKARKRPQWVRR